jgi:hypothetical protein
LVGCVVLRLHFVGMSEGTCVALKKRALLIIKSWRALPLWVQIWVLYLCVVNCLCIFDRRSSTGGSPQATVIAFCGIFILTTNSIVVILYAGFTSLMSLFHLVSWGPMVIYLFFSLILPEHGIWESQYIEPESFTWWMVIIVMVSDAISLGFDVRDTYFFFVKKDRVVPGHELPPLPEPHEKQKKMLLFPSLQENPESQIAVDETQNLLL